MTALNFVSRSVLPPPLNLVQFLLWLALTPVRKRHPTSQWANPRWVADTVLVVYTWPLLVVGVLAYRSFVFIVEAIGHGIKVGKRNSPFLIANMCNSVPALQVGHAAAQQLIIFMLVLFNPQFSCNTLPNRSLPAVHPMGPLSPRPPQPERRHSQVRGNDDEAAPGDVNEPRAAVGARWPACPTDRILYTHRLIAVQTTAC